jgi:hypothetical protein
MGIENLPTANNDQTPSGKRPDKTRASVRAVDKQTEKSAHMHKDQQPIKFAQALQK